MEQRPSLDDPPTLSSSPDRNTFQHQHYLARQAGKGLTVENDDTTRIMDEFFLSEAEQRRQREAEPGWAENNLEYDLRTCEWMLAKVRASRAYAQNLYAAMCNNDFQKLEVMPILENRRWHCSWRYAGGIIADMRQEGDYIDWYCSGIRSDDDIARNVYVGEGVITEEIHQDLKRLGWVAASGGDWESM